MRGYAGRVLGVDLAQEKTEISPLSAEEAKRCLGGMGYAIKLIVNDLEKNVDPLSPDNTLVLATGPFSGLMAPTGWGHVFAAKSPLTGAIGASLSEGFFAGNMKRAGYDAIIIRGASEKATYLLIDDDKVQFMDSRNLWGMEPERVEETIRKDLGDASVQVAAIGPAGERLVRFASIINEGTRAASRTGIGAVMGSKNLKAIAIRGSKEVQVANPTKLLEFCREYFVRAKGSAATKYYSSTGTNETVSVKDRVWLTTHEFTSKYRDLGTAEDILVHNRLGCLPTRNFSSGTFEGAEKVSGEQLNLRYTEKINACSPCPISCEHIALVKEGPYQDAVARMEYSSIWAFGPNCGVDRPDAIIKAVELCNHYGLDETSTGNVIGFAMECFEKGILTHEDVELDLRFGNYQAMLEMICRIGSRHGLGDILAEGVKRATDTIGKGAEGLANHIKGLEMNGYDLRCLKTAALGYAVSFIGADNSRHESHLLDIKRKTNRSTVEKGRGRLVKEMEDYYAVVDSLLVCRHLTSIYEGFESLAELYTIITGLDMTADELRVSGERTNNLARIFNLKQGFTRKDDRIPQKTMKVPLPDGDCKGNVIAEQELNLLLDDYYEARGWNNEGVPTQDKIKELGIEKA